MKRLVVGVLAGFGLFCAVSFTFEAILLAPIGRNRK